MSSEFGTDHGLIHEAVVTGRKVGAGKDFWAILAHSEELFAKVVAFVADAMRVVFNLVAKIDRDMAGWTCTKSVEAKEGEFEPFLVEFLQSGEGCISGEEMLKRAKEQVILTELRHAEAMLREQDKIPVDYRKHYLVFPEVWQSLGGDRYVFCLCWGGLCWCLFYCWVGGDFDSSFRLVGSRK